jgi:hypothetical protein
MREKHSKMIKKINQPCMRDGAETSRTVMNKLKCYILGIGLISKLISN